MRLVFTIILIFFSSSVFPQTVSEDTLMKSYLGHVKASIAGQDYKTANDFLKKAFALKKILPDEAAYYNGVILFNQKKYAPAKTSFRKYLSLAGKEGLYFKETIEYIQRIDLQICPKCDDSGYYEVTDSCTECAGKGKVRTLCKNCQGKGKVLCKTCGGSGVAKQSNGFGGTFQNCPSCGGKGYKTCQTCAGAKEQEIFCAPCSGKGLIKIRVSCSHKPSSSTDSLKLK
jgi:hypothetical protein